MSSYIEKNQKLYILTNFIFLYVNVLLTFGVIYLFLDLFQLGPLINTFAISDQQILFTEKLLNSLYLSTRALLYDGYNHIIPIGWSKIVAIIEGTIGFIIPAFMIINYFSPKEANQVRNRISIHKLFLRGIFVTIGALLVSSSLEIFLVPNHLIDGGIVGVSIMMSYLTGLKLELYLLILNLPFLYLGYRKIGKKFVVTTLAGISILSLGTLFLYNVPVPTNNPILASIFGGFLLGIGVGIVIRYGGSLDGTEILGILLNRKSSISVGTIIMLINIFIFSSAGFIFGWDKAFFSLIAYYIASIMIDITIEQLRI